MNDGIEKLQKYAFGMKPRRCDDILVLADQIQREHVSELQALEERYHTNLRDAREARDIAIKESAEYNHQLGDIIKYLGSCSLKKPVLSSKGRYERIMSELYNRLMPPGMEWPRFDDGEKVKFGDQFIRYDGDVSPVFKFAVNTIDGFNVFDSEGEFIITHGKRIKRPESEVLGADGLPIKVGETVYLISGSEPYIVESLPQRKDGMLRLDGIESQRVKLYCYYPDQLTHTQPDTQERINEDVCKVADACTYFSSDGSCAKCKFVSQYGDADSAYEACPKSVELDQMAILDLLRRQRELDARTMGGE